MPMDMLEALQTIQLLQNAVLDWKMAYDGLLIQYEHLSAYLVAHPNERMEWNDSLEPMPPGEEIPEAHPPSEAWLAAVHGIWAYERRTN